jgi:hypothetical protein
VDRSYLVWVREQRLNLRRENDPPVVDGIVERLDADPVSIEPKLPGLVVPKRYGEHPPKTVQAFVPPLLVNTNAPAIPHIWGEPL